MLAPAIVIKAKRGQVVRLYYQRANFFLLRLTPTASQTLCVFATGGVCYWPNLGYGVFGHKVTMDNSPPFDYADVFHQNRLRLFDIDGSGTTDLIYLGHNGPRYYQNEAGNSWSDAHHIATFPTLDNTSQVQVVDLLGRGTGCLCWSSPLPGHSGMQIRYIDLMGGQKPHLLVSSRNNRGSESRIHHASSTKFYQRDKLTDTPWLTRLPFPVQVVERVETFDRISKSYFVSRYAYHHGHSDGNEREFRGFGMVEQWDTEEYESLARISGTFPDTANVDAASSVPPILTRTWFHTGAEFEGTSLVGQFRKEYYQEPGLGEEELHGLRPDDTKLTNSIKIGHERYLPYEASVEEKREAFRALKGLRIRQEVYGRDGSAVETQPYQASEFSYVVKMLQPRTANKHAVFYSHIQESVGFQYDRKLHHVNGQVVADPRTMHSFTIEVDDFGNVLLSATIGYGRRHSDSEDYSPTDLVTPQVSHMNFASAVYTEGVFTDHVYRLSLPAESRTYQIFNYSPPGRLHSICPLSTPDAVRNVIGRVTHGTHELPFSDFRGNGATYDHEYGRLIWHERTIYRKDDLSGALPPGKMESLALPLEQYKKAFSRGYPTAIYKDKISEDVLRNTMTRVGGYAVDEKEQDLWIPSGRVFYSPDSLDSPQKEIAYAREHIFLPRRFRTPFHIDKFSTENLVTYDKYDLLIEETRDALNNRITVGERNTNPELPLLRHGHDYRVLQPSLVMDPNRNRSAVALDVFGMAIGTAAMGKPEETAGDSLEGFNPVMDESQVLTYFRDPFRTMSALVPTRRWASIAGLGRAGRYSTTRGSPSENASPFSPSRSTSNPTSAPG